EMRKHLRERQTKGFRPLRELNGAVDQSLASVIERCLAHDIEARPKSAARLVRMLKRSNTPAKRVARALVRHPRAGVIASLFLMPIGGGGAYHAATAPSVEERQFSRAMEAYNLGHYKQAVYHLDQALTAAPNMAKGYWHRARAYQQMGVSDVRNYDK